MDVEGQGLKGVGGKRSSAREAFVDEEAKLWQRLHREGIVIHEPPQIGQRHLLYSVGGRCDYMPRRVKGIYLLDDPEERYFLEFEGVGLRIPARVEYLHSHGEELLTEETLIYEVPAIGQTNLAYRLADGDGQLRHRSEPVVAVEVVSPCGTRFRVRFLDRPEIMLAELADTTKRVHLPGFQRSITVRTDGIW
jgi:hypothetical protein